MSDSAAALAHQFDEPAQQYEAASLGMWVFLVTELMFFGGVFTLYTVYRAEYSEAFAQAATHLSLLLGSINTAILLTSSLTMAMAVRSAQLSRRTALIGFIVLTMVLGAIFLGIKFTEYAHKFAEGLVPGPHFTYAGPQPRQAQLFFSFYFAMTGLHALHMIVGLGLLGVLAFQAGRDRFGAVYHTPVDMTALYWHFVDIVWMFLFPLLYLVNRHG